jgi:C4-dicarboxylate-specific signal transduction histidine kinase
VHSEDRHLLEGTIDSQDRDRGTLSAEFRITLPTGQNKWMTAKSHTKRGSKGDISDVSGTFRDITALKDAEAQNALQGIGLAHLMRVAQAGELSGGLAHELTQPLTAILANAQAMQTMLQAKSPDMAEIASVLDDIVEEDNRAGDVIHRLRAFLKNGKSGFNAIDINELVASTLKLLRNELTNHNIKIELVLPAEPPMVSGDLVQLQQVLVNLAMNAVDAVNQIRTYRRCIVVRVDRINDGELEISVKDNGTGLKAFDQQRIFEPFFTTKEEGLGLGLYICSMILKRHGGSLSLVGEPTGGATARFRLPLIVGKGHVS